jgi:predicted hotdog family 3-hydroxylacyl-ACP dehydratase
VHRKLAARRKPAARLGVVMGSRENDANAILIAAIDRWLDLMERCEAQTFCSCDPPAWLRCEREAGHHGAHGAKIGCAPLGWSGAD